jgi:outer membrane protein insertion porin family
MLQRIFLTTVVLLVLGSGLLPAQTIPIISITFEGNSALDYVRLKSQLRTARDGGWYHPEGLKAELQSLEAYYQEEGFLRAKVGDPTVELRSIPGKGQGAVIRVPISEGPRYLAREITVLNVQAFKTATLLSLSPLRTGQPYSRSKIAQWQEKIEDAYHTMGYIRVETRVQEEIHEFKKTVDCRLEFKEGAAYRVGKITVVGDDSINRVEFKKLLLLGEGGLYNPEMLGLSLHFLNNMRAYKPISQSDVEIRIDDATATVDLILHVTPLRKSSSSSGGI